MKSRVVTAALACLLTPWIAACQQDTSDAQGPTPEPATTGEAAIEEHESGPETPLGFGLQVPEGATQLGPLVRYRTDRLIAAYRPELDAALTRRGVNDAVRAAEANPEGVAEPVRPEVVTSSRPARDSFRLLDEPPTPDVTTAVMRVDGDPTDVVTSMARQIDELLPEAGLEPADLTTYCTVADERITSCLLTAAGTAESGEELAVTLSVDPGDVASRTAPPSAMTNPVMRISVELTGDPRVEPEPLPEDGDGDVPDDQTDTEPGPRVVWPAMDLDAPQDTPLLNGWVKPADATLLLSSFTPSFVALHLERGRDADVVARDFAASLGPEAVVSKDVAEQLNEVDTTYTATLPSGEQAVATWIATARGHYVLLSWTPAA